MADWNKDDDGRRVGDWQHKGMRKDANDLVRDPGQQPWYQQNFWIIIFLLAFWPVGIVLCWRSSWPLVVKVLASAFVAVCIGGFVWVRVNSQSAA